MRTILDKLYTESVAWKQSPPSVRHSQFSSLVHNLALEELLAEMEASAVYRLATIPPHDETTRTLEWATVQVVTELRSRIINDRDRYAREAQLVSLPDTAG